MRITAFISVKFMKLWFLCFECYFPGVWNRWTSRNCWFPRGKRHRTWAALPYFHISASM